ncbi:hypothetical protein Dsin_021310 [Dipteronia sinensis]|uniref:Reverse transcriptase domain-containing protein n=1 Tax=Dipteronia sinensis TaxID=43782 RepID=A0AAD9ZZF6_9ROSI|nr:hypothetical protein Dsin_021310 [Dipteronia sinensis]
MTPNCLTIASSSPYVPYFHMAHHSPFEECICMWEPLAGNKAPGPNGLNLNFVKDGLNCLIRKAIRLGQVRGATFGNDIHITHLQFADDTILFFKPKVEYVHNIRRLLRCFELAAGMKLNCHKSCLVKVGKGGPVEEDWAALFHCKKAHLPITYLGLPLRG